MIINPYIFGAYDSDAQLYIDALDAAGYTMNNTEKGWWNTTVLDLKAAFLWSKYLAIYPIIGGTDVAHAINAKNPGTYDLTFNGTWVHDADGALPDGSTAYADPSFNPSGILTFSDIHLSFYSGTTAGSNNGVDIGNNALGVYNHIYANFGGNAYFECPAANMIFAAPANTGGLFTGSRIAVDDAIFKRNTTTLGTNLTDYTGAVMPNSALHISNDGAGEFSDRQCRWASFGYGLSSAQIDDNSDIIGTLQNNYGREV